MTTIKKAWINLGLYILVLGVNFMGAAGFINNMSQKDISDKYETLITPAPMAFSIWSVIYVLVLLTLLYLIIKDKDPAVNKITQLITPLYQLSCVINILWIISFSYDLQLFSVILIFVFALVLAKINTIILENREAIKFRLPALTFSIYGGWVTIATVVNVGALLTKIGWNRFGLSLELTTVITLAIATVLAIFITQSIKSAAYPLPIVWAFFWIYNAHKSPEFFNNQYPMVQWALIAGGLVLVGVAIYRLVKNNICVLPK